MQKRISIIILSCLLFFGCAAPRKIIKVTSYPSDAEIYIDGLRVGVTPAEKEVSFKERKKHEMVIKKGGYEDARTIVTLEPREKIHYHFDLKKRKTVTLELVSFEPKVTKKGAKLAVLRRPTLAYLEVIERSPNVKSVTRITNNEDQNVQIGDQIISPSGDTLIYREWIDEKSGSSYSNIWKQKIGSPARTRITFGKWKDLFPCFTPDGRYIVFSSNRTRPHSTLWMVRTDGGGGIIKLTDTTAEDYSPSVSPDGKVIAYTSNIPGAKEPQIWTISNTGSFATQIREGEFPRISPDGKRIVFVREDKLTEHKQIWVMDMEGSRETLLSPVGMDIDEVQPCWSPDSKWIAFASNEGLDSKRRKNFDIWVMKADGSVRIQLTTNGSHDDSPIWAPDGKSIYFRSNRGGVWNIWRLELSLPQSIEKMK